MLSYFRADKSSQAAGRLLRLHGDAMNAWRLGTLLYLVEREALVRFGAPVAHDAYLAIQSGIVVKSVFDSTFIAEVPREPGLTPEDQLSRAEQSLIDEMFSRHGSWTAAELLEFTRTLPEWREPRGPFALIEPGEILRHAGYSAADRAQIKGEWEEAAYARHLFA